MPTFGFDEQGVRRIVESVRKVEQLPPQKQRGGKGTPGAGDYPTPMHIGKLTAALSSTGTASVTLYGATQASSGDEASLGTTVTAYNWSTLAMSSGTNVLLFRHYGSGRLYALGEPASSELLNNFTFASTVTPSIAVVFRSTDGQIAAGVESSVIINFINSSAIVGYSTSVAKQWFVRTSTGLYWDSGSTCA